MHQADFDLNLNEITKIEGSAGLDVKVRDGKVVDLKFKVQEYKRFYTQGMRGRRAEITPQFVSRICGTCSNAHLLASIEAVEHGLGIEVSEQTKILRKLMINGLMIRDHALHLYIFALPDLVGKDSLVDFDENDPQQNQLLHDALKVKSVGNQLQVYIAGRSVHAPYAAVGGFTQIPSTPADDLINQLKDIRPEILRLIEVFYKHPTDYSRETTYVALRGKESWSFLGGDIIFSTGERVEEKDFGAHFNSVVIPYSQATGFSYKGEAYLVGSLARLNLNKDQLHPKTREDLKEILESFPTHNVFFNNVAQAIEMLHCVDESIDILSSTKFHKEPRLAFARQDGVGVGVIEAPRGLLFYRMEIEEGRIKHGQVVVPTGQNQINIEKDIGHLIQENIDMERSKLEFEIEKLIRAYDPCMSCAAHFLKVKWK